MYKNQQKQKVHVQEWLMLWFYSDQTTGGASLASVSSQHLVLNEIKILPKKSANFRKNTSGAQVLPDVGADKKHAFVWPKLSLMSWYLS